MADLDAAKFGYYRFRIFLFIVVIVIWILIKPTFWQTSIYSQSLVKKNYIDRTRIKSLLKRLKNIGTASEKLYRKALKHALRQEISNRQKVVKK